VAAAVARTHLQATAPRRSLRIDERMPLLGDRTHKAGAPHAGSQPDTPRGASAVFFSTAPPIENIQKLVLVRCQWQMEDPCRAQGRQIDADPGKSEGVHERAACRAAYPRADRARE